MHDVSQYAYQFGRLLQKNSPKILTGLAVGGVFATTILAVKATPAVHEQLENAFFQKNPDDTLPQVPLTKIEILEIAWKGYVPAALMGLGTVSCIVGASSINSKRQAAALGMYSISEKAFREYKESTLHKLGAEKELKIREHVAERRLERDPEKEGTQIILSGSDVKCYDVFTGRYFKSDYESIRQAMNDINFDINNGNYPSLNDFYHRLGMASTAVGEELGWTADNKCDVIFTTHLSENGVPCLAIDFRDHPVKNYYRIF